MKQELENTVVKPKLCKDKTRQGNPCRGNVSIGDYCFAHWNRLRNLRRRKR